MTLSLGTNCGFVLTAPTADPDGAISFTVDNTARCQRDTSPATATSVTEIGWYTNSATEESNFEVCIYSDDGSIGAGAPDVIIGSASITNAKGTTAGWKKSTGLDIAISPNTKYWIGLQCDDTATNTIIDLDDLNDEYYYFAFNQTELPDPYVGNVGHNRIIAIYAKYSTATQPTIQGINSISGVTSLTI